MNPAASLDPHFKSFEEDGFCIVPDVLTSSAIANLRKRLMAAALESVRRGSPTHIPTLDPNASSVRVFNLLDLDDAFLDLAEDPVALEFVRRVIGNDFIVSNFTANIARPGARSMAPHSDLGIIFPGPWVAPWSMNVIWCLDDVYEANGATRYLPGSHHIVQRCDVPDDLITGMQSFEAAAGSIIVLDGRVWHTSGDNVTEDAERACIFGYYSAAFLRGQVNWNALLAPETQNKLSSQMRRYLGLNAAANLLSTQFVDGPEGAPDNC